MIDIKDQGIFVSNSWCLISKQEHAIRHSRE